MHKWQCGVCGYTFDGSEAPERCPKCGAPREQFIPLTDEAAGLVERARLTNHLHLELATLAGEILRVAEQGLEDKLDPGCVAVFTKAREAAWQLRQMVKAEIATHIQKGKWG